MKKLSLGRPSPALVVALAALFVALGGTTYAATSLPKNSVGTAQLKNGAVTKTKIAKTTIGSLRGPRGARGATGAQGATGPMGLEGPTGPQGVQGPSGNGANGQFFSYGNDPAVLGNNQSPSSTAEGAVEGLSQSIATPGIYGNGVNQGVYGQGNSVGAIGQGGPWGVIGNGSLLGLLANSDLGVNGEIYAASSGHIAGTCQVAASQTSATCTFETNTYVFENGTTPIVVVTPTANPGSAYWVSNSTRTGFTLNLASAAPAIIVFNYLVIGINGCVFPGGSSC